MKIILIMSLILVSLNISAVTPIKTGEIAPHSGFIFSKTEEKKVRKIRKENITLKDIVFKQDEAITSQSKHIRVLKRRIDKNRLGTWGKILYVAIGVIATGTSVYLAGKLGSAK